MSLSRGMKFLINTSLYGESNDTSPGPSSGGRKGRGDQSQKLFPCSRSLLFGHPITATQVIFSVTKISALLAGIQIKWIGSVLLSLVDTSSLASNDDLCEFGSRVNYIPCHWTDRTMGSIACMWAAAATPNALRPSPPLISRSGIIFLIR
jgi:hypothetical protein